MTGPQELREAFLIGAERTARSLGVMWPNWLRVQVEADADKTYPGPPAPKPDDDLEKEFLAYISDTPALLSMLYDSDLLPEQTQGTGDYGRTLIIAIHWRRDHTPDPPQASEAKWKCTKCGCRVENPWDGGHLVETCHPTWCGPVVKEDV
jgi:hypothetical protein